MSLYCIHCGNRKWNGHDFLCDVCRPPANRLDQPRRATLADKVQKLLLEHSPAEVCEQLAAAFKLFAGHAPAGTPAREALTEAATQARHMAYVFPPMMRIGDPDRWKK